MNSLHAHLLLLAVCCVGYIACSPVIGQDQRSPIASDNDADVLLAADEMADNGGDNIDKRVERYAFGLGRRAYMYTNGGPGMKRLPVYNFGLGKRSRPYSFGLGKRSDYDYEQDNEIDYRVLPANYLGAESRGKLSILPEIYRGILISWIAVRPGRQNKRTTRPQPFNFGLGRR
ncbi:hypothetical protein KR200_003113 [Drosophila serrata]|nr:hypothetical protein KR200_003113 [Drosophila serrata]